ncbi:MAG TPA: hypothetical protein VF123_06410 [Candidatus Sulfotelmatobacter sp.]
MRSLFGLLVVAFVFIVGGFYSYRRMQQVPLIAPAVPPKPYENPKDYTEAKQAAQAVKIVGPLADYMANQEGSTPAAKDVETVTWIPTASDHVGGSVVGSTVPILRKSFTVRSAVQVAFQVPAHAASPQLRGTFQSSAAAGADAPIEVLVLSDDEYFVFVNRRAGDAIFIAEDAPAANINTRLPPTINQPARYHLIFRNNSRAEGKKFVKADFRLEF